MWLFRKKVSRLNPEDILSDTYRYGQIGSDNFDGVISMPINRWGIYFIISICFLFCFLFVYRAYSLQIAQYENFKEKSFRNNYIGASIPSVRGSILDSRGEVLARTSKISTTIDQYSRVYTDRAGLGNVLGFVSYPKKDKSGNFWQENFKGVEGIEDYYDQLLSGQRGERLYEKTADGDIGANFIGTFPVDGKSITLSIDAELQELIYKKMAKFHKKHGYEGGAAVIMNIDTGELISLVSYPTYDPNLLMPDTLSTTTNRSEYYEALQENELKPFINRAISGVYPPGSIIKPLFALAALNEEYISPVTSIFSSGQISVPNPYTGIPTIFRDWKAHGWTNAREAIAVSSDVFFYSIVGGYELQKGMGIATVDKYAKAFGLESKTGVDLSGEKIGLIPTPDWKLKVFGEPWRLGDSYNSSIGQFGFNMTPIGAATMVAAIANSGYLMQPKILKPENGIDSVIKRKVDLIVKEKWYELARSGMRLTVTDGTARNLNMPFVEVAAKTGTAEIGTTKRDVHTWITGFFPYEKPKYAFVLISEKGDRGNSPNPSWIMREALEWMRTERPEYLGYTEAQIEKIKQEKDKEENNNQENIDDTATDTEELIEVGEIRNIPNETLPKAASSTDL